MPIRTYRCLKDGCDHLFDTTSEKPKCPACKSKRLRWVPVRVAVGKVAKGLDTELRACADAYGLTNLRSAKAGESAKLPSAPDGAQMQPHSFGGGWQGGLWTDSGGRILEKASCTIAPGISSKVSPEVGRGSAGVNPNLALSRFTEVEARHTGRA